MNRPLLTELPYHADSIGLFDSIADRPWAMLLDSGRPATTQGRYDILATDPYITLTTWGEMTEIHTGSKTSLTPEDPFLLIYRLLGPPRPSIPGLPFCGGAMGYFAYDLGRRLEHLPVQAQDAESLPELVLGIYDWAVVVDHHTCRTWLIGQGLENSTRERWSALVEQFSTVRPSRQRVPFRVLSKVRSNMDRDRYAAAFQQIKRYIREGDCYQVNFAQRFWAPYQGNPWLAYRMLRVINPAHFAAYLNTPYTQVLSVSPECFLRVRGRRVETHPIKGTRPRVVDPAQDQALRQALLTSPKDRAENVMIVDLLRNDLGKNCALGSIRVPKLFTVESFPTVHHLVSTVTGDLKAHRNTLALLRGCFPGGSVTGAPKLRAMQIIEELEPHRRGVYCGALGYIGFDGSMDTNIAIRTLVCSDGVVRFWAGGGIVTDSDLDTEYRETFDKAAAMLELLQRSGTAGQAALTDRP